MRDWQSQAHVKHYCRYHSVFVPKYRWKAIYGTLRNEIGRIFRELCRQGGLELVEGYAMRDHIHMLCKRTVGTDLQAAQRLISSV